MAHLLLLIDALANITTGRCRNSQSPMVLKTNIDDDRGNNLGDRMRLARIKRIKGELKAEDNCRFRKIKEDLEHSKDVTMLV